VKCLFSGRVLPGCDAVYCCGRIPKVQRTMLPPFSGWSGEIMTLPNVGTLPHYYTVS
jgi:hypothetical protein